MATVLGVENVSFHYGSLGVLRNVNLQLDQGEFAAMIGANGTGKSTLLKLLLGELSLQEGSISLFGQPLTSFHNWPMVGYVPQNCTAMAQGFPANSLEIVEQGEYSGVLKFQSRKSRRKRAEEALERMGVAHLRHRLIGEMSGGQIQRVMIARLLVRECRLILLDEPSTGMDSASVEELYETLGALNKEQDITIFMVTHDIQRVTPYLHRVFCLEEGDLVELERHQLEHELSHKHKHLPPFSGEEA